MILADQEIAFYISYSRPMMKILVIAAITYQIVKFVAGKNEREANVGDSIPV